VLKYLTDKWNLGPLGRRTAAAASIGVAVRETAPRTNTIPFIRVSYTVLVPEKPEWDMQDDSGHHDALQAFAHHLETLMGGVRAPAATTSERMSNLADRIRNGELPPLV
jgi:phospholipase C